MKYASARPMIANGDLLCFQGKWWLSHRIVNWQRIARWLGLSRHYTEAEQFSHTGVAVWMQGEWDAEPRLWAVEATGGGVRAEPVSALVRNYRAVGGRVCWKPLDAGAGLDGVRIAAEAVELCGRPYLSFIWQWLQYAAAWAGLKHDFDPDAYMCSETTATALQNAGLQDIHPASMMPANVISLPIWSPELIELEF